MDDAMRFQNFIGADLGHFGLQHFTASAVSTGLTVTARMNDPFW